MEAVARTILSEAVAGDRDQPEPNLAEAIRRRLCKTERLPLATGSTHAAAYYRASYSFSSGCSTCARPTSEPQRQDASAELLL